MRKLTTDQKITIMSMAVDYAQINNETSQVIPWYNKMTEAIIKEIEGEKED